ncbi:MAG: hypothetical protein HUU54_09615 [Ignavibacteriaceae bacterium]|nr:hypothetical protein [Ignavibacteriaceae bacterium]
MSNLYHEEDEKFKDVINALKGLKRVDAPEDFELNLFREINAHKHQRKSKLLFGVLPRFTLIPASVVFTILVVSVVIIFNQTSEVVPLKQESTLPEAKTPPSIVEPRPEITDKQTAPVQEPKTVRREEYTAPQEKEITSTTRAKSETNTTTAIEAGESGAPAVTSDNVVSTAKRSDSTVAIEKAGKVSRKDTLKKKKEDKK